LLGLPGARPSVSANPKARAAHQEARRLEAAGQPADAARLFAGAVELDPSPDHLLDAGVHLLAHGAPARAAVFLERGLRANPESADLRLAMGLSQFALGRHEQAKQAFLATQDERALEGLAMVIEGAPALAPSLVEPLARSPFHQALALLRTPGSEGAVRQRAEALLIRSTEQRSNVDRAWFELGRFYLDQGRTRDGEKALRSAVEANPDHELAHYRLAQVYQRSGRAAEADVHFKAYRRLHARRLAAEESERKRIVLVEAER
jgi:tetratricopeptide (TPR) repeat protein